MNMEDRYNNRKTAPDGACSDKGSSDRGASDRVSAEKSDSASGSPTPAKRILAIIALILIAGVFVCMVYAIVTGNPRLLMGCFFCLVVGSVLLYLLFMLLKLHRER